MTEQDERPGKQDLPPSYTAPVDPADDEGLIGVEPEAPNRDPEQIIEDLEQTKNRH